MTISIDLNVLKSTVELIDVVTQRGAIRGEELLAVGQIRASLAKTVEEASASLAEGETSPEENTGGETLLTEG